MNKLRLLQKEAEFIEKCKACKVNKIGKAVPGEGNPNAKIMFVGEAPGKQESLTGIPFVGRSGKFLTELLKSIGISRKDVYITSPVKYFPGYRAPTNIEINHGRKHLQKQIDIIGPKLIVLLGKVAGKGVLGRDLMVSKIHGKLIKENGRNYFVTFHPSAVIRFPKIRSLLTHDFRKLKIYLNQA